MTAISNPEHARHQQGMATLMFAVVLLIALTVITFLSAKTLLTEQAISANEYRAKEAGYAAEAALEYGIAWLDANDPADAAWQADDLNGDGENGNDLSADATTVISGSDTYNLTVDYLRACIDDSASGPADCEQWLIEVTARAEADADQDLQRTQRIRVLQVLNPDDISQLDFIRVPGSWRDWEVTP